MPVVAWARQAADAGDDASPQAVVEEALRLRPVIWEVARLTTADPRPEPARPRNVTCTPGRGGRVVLTARRGADSTG